MYRARPNLRFGGIDWPLFAILGGLGTAAAWLVVVVQDAATRWAGLGWLALGFVVYAVYRRRTVGLTSARDRAGARDRPRPRAAGGVPHDRGAGGAFGRVGGGARGRGAPRRGAPGARSRSSTCSRCRWTCRCGADLRRAGGEARPARRRAGAGGELRRPRGHPPRARARRAGPAIVADADARNAELVVVGRRAAARAPGQPIFGSTVAHVLEHSPAGCSSRRAGRQPHEPGSARPSAVRGLCWSSWSSGRDRSSAPRSSGGGLGLPARRALRRAPAPCAST